jgi:hypothetical protein
MILFTNDTKEYNNEVRSRLPRTGYGADPAHSTPRTAPRKAEDARLLAGLNQAVHCIAACAFTLAAITIAGVFLSLAPSITGEAQEGHSSGWMGEKLAAREAAR